MKDKIKDQVKGWIDSIDEGLAICKAKGYDGSSYQISLVAKRDAYTNVMSYIDDLEREQNN